MPEPTLNWQPQGAGWRQPTHYVVPQEARLPSETRGWFPGPGLDWGYASALPHLTEAGGAMMTKGDLSMSGMGDMFVFPEGTNPNQFYQQQLQTAAMPTPGQPIPIDIQGQQMEETFMYDRSVGHPAQVGQMSWESGPAPWEQTALPNHMFGPVYPGDAPHEIARLKAAHAADGDAKAVQAVQAAKVAADNAVRAAKAGAPTVAATNAATAQAAANVAEGSAVSDHGRRAAALARQQATKAVAAANVAANGRNGNGMGDWMELSGLGATGLLDQTVMGFKVKHLALGALGLFALVKYGPKLKKLF